METVDGDSSHLLGGGSKDGKRWSTVQCFLAALVLAAVVGLFSNLDRIIDSGSDSSTQLPKILCLHGGGGSASGFAADPGVQALQDSLRNAYEFVFAQTPEDGGVWIRDPPSKDEPTTDPNWANASVAYLDTLIATDGPFAGILGYSQGSAFSTYYVATAQTAQNEPFTFAMLFCGYLPTTHLGLVDLINRTSPFFDIPALVFMGQNDWIISNAMTNEQAAEYTNPTVITSATAGHHVPEMSDPTFDQVVNFALAQLESATENAGDTTNNAPTAAPTATSTVVGSVVLVFGMMMVVY